MRAGGKGAYGAVDPVGGPFAAKITQSLRDSGTLIVYSSMAGFTSDVGIPDLLYRDVRVRNPVGVRFLKSLIPFSFVEP